jgi:hypothetical protein
MSSNLPGETVPMACSCFFGKLRNNHKVYSIYSIQKRKSKYSFGEEIIKQRGKSIWLEKNIMRKLFREEEDEIFIEEREGTNQLFVLLWKRSDLDLEAFVEGKPEFPKNFSTGGERSILKSIETIFIALQLHWSNGYCISPSSSDDG